MKKVSQKEMDQRKSRYYGMLQFYEKLRKGCLDRLGVEGFSAVCFVLKDDGYEAYFHDALVASQLTSLPVTPDFGFVRLDVIAEALKPTIEAIHKDGRAVFVLDKDENGRDIFKAYLCESHVEKQAVAETEKELIVV